MAAVETPLKPDEVVDEVLEETSKPEFETDVAPSKVVDESPEMPGNLKDEDYPLNEGEISDEPGVSDTMNETPKSASTPNPYAFLGVKFSPSPREQRKQQRESEESISAFREKSSSRKRSTKKSAQGESVPTERVLCSTTANPFASYLPGVPAVLNPNDDLDNAYTFLDYGEVLFQEVVSWMGYYHSKCAFVNTAVEKEVMGPDGLLPSEKKCKKLGHAMRKDILEEAIRALGRAKQTDGGAENATTDDDAATNPCPTTAYEAVCVFLRNQRMRINRLFSSCIDGSFHEGTDEVTQYNSFMRSALMHAITRSQQLADALHNGEDLPNLADFDTEEIEQADTDEALTEWALSRDEDLPPEILEKRERARNLRTDFNCRALESAKKLLTYAEVRKLCRSMDPIWAALKILYTQSHTGKIAAQCHKAWETQEEARTQLEKEETNAFTVIIRQAEQKMTQLRGDSQ